ncbi:unnamed protein product [Gongylonema pulchrum]|uniref:Uncharacterized protein n=1 Tax=Gongylonema pulchrum TaxID=637853 RepID=A0A3P7NI61_9BILA|nr:unnamed protein product [Gongylonema pulchrum]
MLYHDQCFEPAPEVKEALRRLNLKEPWLFDERKIRLYHAHTLKSHGDLPYLDEIEEEKKTRADTSGLIPGYQLKQHH